MKVVTDSTADLPKEIVEKYGIEIVPLTVQLGDRTFRDYYDLSPLDFYEMLKQTDDFPTTSQPSVEEFLSTYKKLGKDEDILSIHISIDMSATSQSARVASQQLPEWKVTVVDSRSVSVGLGIMVLEIAKAVKEGANIKEALELLEKLKSSVRIYFSVDSLDYLQKGGRIGKAQAFLGTMLKIKPLLAVEDGIVTPVERIRGGNKLISRMVEIVKEDAVENKPLKSAFVCGESEDKMAELIKQVKEAIQIEELFRSRIGTIITSHAGPTAFAISYIRND